MRDGPWQDEGAQKTKQEEVNQLPSGTKEKMRAPERRDCDGEGGGGCSVTAAN